MILVFIHGYLRNLFTPDFIEQSRWRNWLKQIFFQIFSFFLIKCPGRAYLEKMRIVRLLRRIRDTLFEKEHEDYRLHSSQHRLQTSSIRLYMAVLHSSSKLPALLI